MRNHCELDRYLADLSYTLRRYWVDDFFFRQADSLSGLVLDLGGNKLAKRGHFDIEKYDLRVVYANYSTKKRPDVKADAGRVPFREGIFDTVICAELLEHVLRPDQVLREVYRVLKPGGRVLITVPFLVHIHGDPSDYGRYTDQYWSEILREIGFQHVAIEKQGKFWTVLLEMMRGLFVYSESNGRFYRLFLKGFLRSAIVWGRRKALIWDGQKCISESNFFSSFTTGFGIVAMK